VAHSVDAVQGGSGLVELRRRGVAIGGRPGLNRPMLRTGPLWSLLLCAAVAGAAPAGCRGEEGEGGAAGADDVAPLTSAEFYRTYTALRGAERLERFGDGVALTGRVTRTVDMSDMGGLQLWLAADGEAWVTARFADGGAAARQVQVGDTVTLRCAVAGAMGKKVSLADCELLQGLGPSPRSP
jgi:hypothetical protein